MQVNTVHSTLGWFGSRLQTETRSVYHYDKGNDVVVVERRYIDMSLYDHRAVLPSTDKGRTIDVTA